MSKKATKQIKLLAFPAEPKVIHTGNNVLLDALFNEHNRKSPLYERRLPLKKTFYSAYYRMTKRKRPLLIVTAI